MPETPPPKDDEDGYVKFAQLLAQAASEGRLNGRYRCPVCGMRYGVKDEVARCCAPMKRGGA